MRLRFRGVLRQIRRTLSTPKGKLLGGAGALFVVLWAWSVVVEGTRSGAPDPAAARAWMPLYIVLMIGTVFLRSSTDRAIAFSPAEVHFLFSGPFSRRQLLLYRVAILALASLGLSIFLALMGTPYLGSPFRTFPGIVAVLLLGQFSSLLLAVLRERVGLGLSGRLRWGFGGLVFFLLASGLLAAAGSLDPGDPQRLLEAVRAGPGWRAVELVLSPFAMAITAPTITGLMAGLAGATAINGVLVGAILLVDANYLEAASRIGQRTYTVMERAKTQGIAVANSSRAHRRVPPLPHWGGAGTIAWRQLTALRRGSLGLVILFLAGAAVGGGWIALSEPEMLMFAVMGFLFLPMILMIADALRFDFRGDLGTLEALKSMPIGTTPLVLGQIAVPTLLLTLAVLALLGPPLAAAGYVGAVPFVGILLLLVSALVFGAKNYLFLHFPVNLRERNPADIRFLGRTILFLLIEGIVVVVAVGASALFAVVATAVPAFVLSVVGVQLSAAAFLALGTVAFGIALCGPILVVLRMTGRAYGKLDPSRLLAD